MRLLEIFSSGFKFSYENASMLNLLKESFIIHYDSIRLEESYLQLHSEDTRHSTVTTKKSIRKSKKSLLKITRKGEEWICF